MLEKIILRLTKYLERKGIIAKDLDQPVQLEIPGEDVFAQLQASSVTYRFATGPAKGKKAMVLSTVPDEDHLTKSGLVEPQLVKLMLLVPKVGPHPVTPSHTQSPSQKPLALFWSHLAL